MTRRDDQEGAFSACRFAAGARNFLSKGLKNAGIENSLQEADWIVTRLLNISRAELLAHPQRDLTDPQVAAIMEVFRRRVSREPLQYIFNEAHFWGLTFEVGEGVLVPRPETELLVELALEFLPSAAPSPLFLDWGAGSGCIAVALLLQRPGAKALLAEKNPRSLRWARRNVERYQLHSRAFLWHPRGNEVIPPQAVLDLVVANPPYIPTKDIRNLMEEVRDYEPHLALDGGEDGMDFYRMLFQNVCVGLKPGGTLVLEIGGAGQAAALRAMAPSSLSLVKEVPDYAGIPRCMAWRYLEAF